MSFYCITIFYLRHSVSLRLLFGVFGKVVISASRRMFVNNSSIFFGALSSYFKAGAGQRYISAGSTAVQGKKPDTPSLDALCLLERSVTLPFVSLMKVKLVAFFPLSGRCTICSQMEQLLSLTLSEWQTTFNLLRKMYRVQCYYFLLQTFVLFLPLTVEFTTRQANRVVLFFFCYKSGHIFSLTIFMSNLPRDVKFPVQKLIQTHTTSYRLLISLIIIKIKNKKHSGN